MLLALVDIERNGICIDVKELNSLEEKYRKRHKQIKQRLDEMAREALGATPFNLDSPEKLSQLLYSRRIKDKAQWKYIFNVGTELKGSTRKKKYPNYYPPKQFQNLVVGLTKVLRKTKVVGCPTCKRTGRLEKRTVKGELYKNLPKCPDCKGEGVRYISTGEVAGFKLIAKSSKDVTALGFATNKDKLKELIKNVENKEAKEFVSLLEEYNAVSTYITTFIGGIRRGLRGSSVLHTEYMQTVTATGRLSSRNPNYHNQPRGTYCEHCKGDKCERCLQTGYKFPIRKVVVSRFPGGKIGKADYARLEFVIAADLARCDVALTALNDPEFDPHSYSAEIIGVNRQDAKPHTFKPLYGGVTGSAREINYYSWFQQHYTGITEWHKKLISEAITSRKITLPSGRWYDFSGIRQFSGGSVSNSTQIKNYPVQGFATADIVPISTVSIDRAFKAHDLRSVLINEVHDENVWDCYPGEEEITCKLVYECMMAVISQVKERYDYEIVAPIDVEVSMGYNWLEMENINVN